MKKFDWSSSLGGSILAVLLLTSSLACAWVSGIVEHGLLSVWFGTLSLVTLISGCLVVVGVILTLDKDVDRETERQKFEKWVKKNTSISRITRDVEGGEGYDKYDLNLAWQAWKGAVGKDDE